jgi:hypothetical protein
VERLVRLLIAAAHFHRDLERSVGGLRHDGLMTSWGEFAAAEPEFAARVRQLFTVQKHLTMATLRRDGSPRISGTEVSFDGYGSDRGELVLGMMAGSLKALDLLRDPRVALHGPTFDPPEADPSGWTGDAKIAGRAVEAPDTTPPPDAPQDAQYFRIEVAEVVWTGIGTPADHLLIESWTPAAGRQTRKRY